MIARHKPIRKRRKGKVAATRRRLNLMWSEIIRRSNGGRCRLAGGGYDHLECMGGLQAAHCFGKKAMPAVRFELWAGWPLCPRHHTYYTHQVERWTWVLIREWGLALYTERYALACAVPNHDYAAIEAELLEAMRQVA